jgi:hypothetical protein
MCPGDTRMGYLITRSNPAYPDWNGNIRLKGSKTQSPEATRRANASGVLAETAAQVIGARAHGTGLAQLMTNR